MDDFLHNQGVAIANDQCLVAMKGVTAGSTLLSQQPLASVPRPTIRGQRCNYCLRKTALQCCSRCRSAYFCSNDCFRSAWLQFHRVLCEPQEYDIYVDVDADRWLLERAALTLHSHNRLSKHHSHSPPQLPLAIDSLDLLQPATAAAADKTQHTNIDLGAVAAALEPFNCHYSTAELELLWHKLQKATFDVYDHDQHLEPIAQGVYPLTALYVRHSCRPNAGVVYKRGEQVLIALDDLHPGDPVTISYVDLVQSKPERMAQLKQRFGDDFECHCSRCDGEYQTLDLLLDASPEERPGYDEAEIERQCQSWNILNMVKTYQTIATPRVLDASNYTHYISRILTPDIYDPATDRHRRSESAYHVFAREDKNLTARRVVPALAALSQVPSVPAFTLQSIRAARNLLRKLISENRWVEASRCALYLFITYRFIYPPLHPTLSYHSLIVARASWNSLVQLELAGIGRKLERIYENGVRTWIAVARESVLNTFGQETNLWREIVELQWIFERDQKLK